MPVRSASWTASSRGELGLHAAIYSSGLYMFKRTFNLNHAAPLDRARITPPLTSHYLGRVSSARIARYPPFERTIKKRVELRRPFAGRDPVPRPAKHELESRLLFDSCSRHICFYDGQCLAWASVPELRSGRGEWRCSDGLRSSENHPSLQTPSRRWG